MSDYGTSRLNLVLEGNPDSDQDELDALTLQLRDRLLELEVDHVDLDRSHAAPVGAKPGEVIALGSLAVTMAPLALRAVLRLLEKWIEHQPVRAVSITIGGDTLDLQAISSADQRQLIHTFVTAHESTITPTAVPKPAPKSGTHASGGNEVP